MKTSVALSVVTFAVATTLGSFAGMTPTSPRL